MGHKRRQQLRDTASIHTNKPNLEELGSDKREDVGDGDVLGSVAPFVRVLTSSIIMEGALWSRYTFPITR